MGDENKPHLTTDQAAQRLHMSKGGLANMRSYGGGPRYMKIGRRVLYPVDEIERWERMHLRSNTGEG